MDKRKAVMGAGRRWAVDFSDQSTVPSSRDILDPPGFSRVSPEQVLNLNQIGLNFEILPRIEMYSPLDLIDFRCFQDDSATSRQKKDAEANWKLQVLLMSNLKVCYLYIVRNRSWSRCYV